MVGQATAAERECAGLRAMATRLRHRQNTTDRLHFEKSWSGMCSGQYEDDNESLQNNRQGSRLPFALAIEATKCCAMLFGWIWRFSFSLTPIVCQASCIVTVVVAIRSLILPVIPFPRLRSLVLCVLELLALLTITCFVLSSHLLLLFLFRIFRFLSLSLFLRFVLFRHLFVDVANLVDVKHDGVWLKLIQQVPHFLLSPLLLRLEGIRLKAIEVGKPCARY